MMCGRRSISASPWAKNRSAPSCLVAAISSHADDSRETNTSYSHGLRFIRLELQDQLDLELFIAEVGSGKRGGRVSPSCCLRERFLQTEGGLAEL